MKLRLWVRFPDCRVSRAVRTTPRTPRSLATRPSAARSGVSVRSVSSPLTGMSRSCSDVRAGGAHPASADPGKPSASRNGARFSRSGSQRGQSGSNQAMVEAPSPSSVIVSRWRGAAKTSWPTGASPRAARTWAAATVPWPHKVSSIPVAENQRRPRTPSSPAGRRNAVAGRAISAATACMADSSSPVASRTTAAGLPANGVDVNASTRTISTALTTPSSRRTETDRTALGALASRVLARDDPERARGAGPHVLPGMQHSPVKVSRVAGLEEVALAVVVEGDLAIEDVHELHLARLDEDALGRYAGAPAAEGRDDRPDLAPEQSGRQH